MSSRFVPISQISSYLPRWEIQARVIQKSPLNSFTNKRGGPDNQVFSVDMLDREGDVIRGKFWNADAIRWNATLEKGKTYNFKNGKVQIANKRFTSLSHNYEITFDASTEITETSEAICGETRRFNFVDLRSIKSSSRELPFMIDLLAVVKNVRPFDEITTKRNDQISRRNLTVVDSSEHQMELTLWGELAQNSEWVEGAVFAAQSVQIREFRGGRVGQTARDSYVSFSPSGDEATKLKEWFIENGSRVTFETLRTGEAATEGSSTKQLNLSEAQEAGDALNVSENGLFFGTPVFVTRIFYASRDGAMQPTYYACPKCNKKVTDSGGGFRCEGCDAVVDPQTRYLFGAWFADAHRGRFSGKLFHDAAQNLLLQQDSGTVASWVAADEKPSIKFLFDHQALWTRFSARMRMKQDMFRGETRLNTSVMSLDPFNYNEHANAMLQAIRVTCPTVTEPSVSRKRKVSEEVDETDENICKNRKVTV